MENKEITLALLKAQKDMMGAKKDAKNPFFKSNYATLNSVWEACKDALHDNSLVLLQPIDIIDGVHVVKTILMHTSGEQIISICPILCTKPNDPQAMGSAITYARRYSLASIIGIVTDDDDDGNKASNKSQQKKQEPAPEDTTERAKKAITALDNAKTSTDLEKYIKAAKILIVSVRDAKIKERLETAIMEAEHALSTL